MFGNNYQRFGLNDPNVLSMGGFNFNNSYQPNGNNITLGNGMGLNNKTGNTGGFENLELGMNIPTMQLALGGLQSIGNLWGAYNSNKLANKQLNFTMDAYNQNMAMQKKTHNTALEDRTRARGKFEGHSQEYMDDYNKKNRL